LLSDHLFSMRVLKLLACFDVPRHQHRLLPHQLQGCPNSLFHWHLRGWPRSLFLLHLQGCPRSLFRCTSEGATCSSCKKDSAT
jgi:hypothetical protein